MKYLLDTNILREIGKTAPHKHVHDWLQTVDDAELAISALRSRDEIVESQQKNRDGAKNAGKESRM